MLYVFGDSSAYGVTLPEEIREQSTWAYFLSKKMNVELKNFALPGSSNWRFARILNNLSLTSEDLVVISWSNSERFEFGVNEGYEITSNKDLFYRGDDIEKEGNFLCKRFFPQLGVRTADKLVKKFAELTYNEFFNVEWFEEMFKIMFNSCLKKLTDSNCKWLMFNAWCNQYSKEDNCFNYKNYLLGYKNNMASHINKPIYWEAYHNEIIANFLFDEYNKIYG